MPNPAVLASLDEAEKISDRYAQLIFESSGAVLSFLYNPESLSYSRQSKNVEAVVMGAEVNDQNYLGASGKTLQLSNLLFDSFDAGKSLTKILSGLEALLLPKKTAGQSPAAQAANQSPAVFASERVFFSWGKFQFGPAIVTEISWEETLWLDGEPAAARVNLALTQVPAELPTGAAKAATAEVEASRGNLTPRQQNEGQSAAEGYLRQNLALLVPREKLALQSGRFSLSTAEDGAVQLGGFGAESIVVGQWDGFAFSPAAGYKKS
jgi:hypothetical protein